MHGSLGLPGIQDCQPGHLERILLDLLIALSHCRMVRSVQDLSHAMLLLIN